MSGGRGGGAPAQPQYDLKTGDFTPFCIQEANNHPRYRLKRHV